MEGEGIGGRRGRAVMVCRWSEPLHTSGDNMRESHCRSENEDELKQGRTLSPSSPVPQANHAQKTKGRTKNYHSSRRRIKGKEEESVVEKGSKNISRRISNQEKRKKERKTRERSKAFCSIDSPYNIKRCRNEKKSFGRVEGEGIQQRKESVKGIFALEATYKECITNK